MFRLFVILLNLAITSVFYKAYMITGDYINLLFGSLFILMLLALDIRGGEE